MKNLLDYKDGYSFLPGTAAWEEKWRSVGAFVWRGVLGSQGKRTYDRLDRIYAFMVGSAFSMRSITGDAFPARYDNRHKLNIVVSHKLSEKVELTAA